MQNEESLNPAEQALESALGQLRPAANRLNRDELMFKAGLAAAGAKRPWQMLSGILTVLLIGSILIRPGSNGSGESQPAPGSAEYDVARVFDSPAEVWSDGSLEYVTLRQNVVERGLDGLPSRRSAGPSETHTSRKQLLESMLSS